MESGSVERILEQLRAVERRLEALERRHSEGEGQPFEERRVVDLIVDLVEERIARLLPRGGRFERGGERQDDGREGRGERSCCHCGGGHADRGRGR